MDLPVVVRSTGTLFLHQRLADRLVDYRKDDISHSAVGVSQGRRSDPEQDECLALNLLEVVEEILDDPAFGANGDAMRDLQQEVDQAINDLGLPLHAVEYQQGQADVLRMSPKLSGALGRGPPAEPLDQIRVERSQNVGWQAKVADCFELLDFLKQALQPTRPGSARRS
jgi:hypothetical protein